MPENVLFPLPGRPHRTSIRPAFGASAADAAAADAAPKETTGSAEGGGGALGGARLCKRALASLSTASWKALEAKRFAAAGCVRKCSC